MPMVYVYVASILCMYAVFSSMGIAIHIYSLNFKSFA
jgi:hypothetical protein